MHPPLHKHLISFSFGRKQIDFVFYSTENGTLVCTQFGPPSLHGITNRAARAQLERSRIILGDASAHPLAIFLRNYFSGKQEETTRFVSNSMLSSFGSPFHVLVWKTVRAIPQGETSTYGDIARQIGRVEAARAVGSAVKNNPFPLLIPCHRVLPKSSSGILDVGTYVGGSVLKRLLLEHEGVQGLRGL